MNLYFVSCLYFGKWVELAVVAESVATAATKATKSFDSPEALADVTACLVENGIICIRAA